MCVDARRIRSTIVQAQVALIDINARSTSCPVESFKTLQTAQDTCTCCENWGQRFGAVDLAIVGVAEEALVAFAVIRALAVDALLGGLVACILLAVALVDVLAETIVHAEAIAAHACVRAQRVLANGVLLGACVVGCSAFVYIYACM